MNKQYNITTSPLQVTVVNNGFILARDGDAIFTANYLIDDIIRSLDDYLTYALSELEDGYAYTSDIETIDYIKLARTAFGVIVTDDSEGIIILISEIERLIEVLKE